MTFGDELALLLDDRHMTQTDLAAALDLTPGAVSAWTTGAKRPSRDNAIKVETILDVRPRGRLVRALGYAPPDTSDAGVQLSLEDHVRADPTLTAEDRRTLLRLLRLIRIANRDRVDGGD